MTSLIQTALDTPVAPEGMEISYIPTVEEIHGDLIKALMGYDFEITYIYSAHRRELLFRVGDVIVAVPCHTNARNTICGLLVLDPAIGLTLSTLRFPILELNFNHFVQIIQQETGRGNTLDEAAILAVLREKGMLLDPLHEQIQD